MKENLQNQPAQQEIAGLKPESNSTQNVDVPTVARNKQARIVWTVKGGIPEDNLRLGINNIRALVLAEAPELSSFTRGENGRIREEDREQVESLILERVRRDKTLVSLTTVNNQTPYPEKHQYFRQNIIYTLRTAFEEYGLFENKVQQSLENLSERKRRREEAKSKLGQDIPSTIRLVDNKNNTESEIKPVKQETGRKKLFKLIKGDLDIDDIEPIYVTNVKRQGNSAVIYAKDRSIIILNSDSYKAWGQTGALIAIPHHDTKFDYRWLDFYAVEQNNTVDLNSKLDSVRFNPETNKFENLGWYGPEQQSFIDYMSGILTIDDPSELPPFIAKINEDNSGTYLGRHQNKVYSVRFSQPLHTSSQEVLIKTKYDPKRKYVWIEGYDAKDIEQSNPLFTRRIIDVEVKGDDHQKQNKKEKPLVDWKDPQTQSIIDWVDGRLPIEDAEEATILLDENKKSNDFTLGEHDLRIQLEKNKKFDRTKPLYLAARQDDLYKWVEVQQDDNESNERITISSSRLEYFNGKPKLNGNWPGPDRQVIIDYIDGKIDPKYLRRSKLRVGSNGKTHIAIFKGKQLSISYSIRNNLFSVGDIIQVIPTTDDSGELILGVARENEEEILQRYKYNREKGNFYVLDDQKEKSGTISPDQANEWLRRLVGELDKK